ncbi:MBL fold metallo-hydrolase [Thermopolyspora flexuosa]|uniref:MBL fold metallo-hydrolase n=1 Tax=Thermopolyspora flexuosa TaxID=103836 RepID=UPI001B867559|nr:MBL fold metallo-hydrolase [Thermopolyspora flexuosa]
MRVVFFQQFYLESLGHASYLVGDERTGKALVFDPRRDVDVYLAAARAAGVRIAYAADSHGHNDYLSGLIELRGRAGAELWGSAVAELGYPHRALRDGEVVEVGDVGVEVWHTPGHTPEHISLVLYDRAVSADVPVAVLSGGSLLVGDVARPDLLGGADQVREAARALRETVDRLLTLPDHVLVYPTHVAGSLCGGRIGRRLSTTVGYERLTNPAIGRPVALGELPAVPPYWRRMRPRNLAGVAPLGVIPEPPALEVAEFDRRRLAGAHVLDTRAPEAFGGGHIPGALNVGLGPAFATWAGTVLPEAARVLLVLDRAGDLWEAVWQLLRIGYPPPQGWLAGGMAAWRISGRPVAFLPQITVEELYGRFDRGEADLLDVRQPAEWSGGHVPGAVHVTGAELAERMDEVPGSRPLAVICSSGYRSSVAASLLAHRGRTGVHNVTGGMAAWTAAGLPVVTPGAR